MLKISPKKEYNFIGSVPPDKSISHRAVMLACISDSESVIENPLMAEDIKSTIKCMETLGAKIQQQGNRLYVQPIKVFNDNVVLDCGNSGTTMRLLAGLIASRGIKATLIGDSSLSKRPMQRVVCPLEKLGANIRTTDGKAPLYIDKAIMKGGNVKIDTPSAQVKSAVMLAALNCENPTEIEFSTVTRDHTERMFKAMGVDFSQTGNKIRIAKSQPRATNMTVCGDFSSSVFPLSLGILRGKATVKNVNINPTRSGFLKALDMFGASYEITNRHEVCGEEVADITTQKSSLKPITLGGDLIANIIDELPMLAVLMCFANGVSVVKNAEELKIKESDRIKLIVENLQGLGACARQTEDGFEICGSGKIVGDSDYVIFTAGDHRIAMSMTIAALASERGGRIDDIDCCKISYPSFAEDMQIN